MGPAARAAGLPSKPTPSPGFQPFRPRLGPFGRPDGTMSKVIRSPRAPRVLAPAPAIVALAAIAACSSSADVGINDRDPPPDDEQVAELKHIREDFINTQLIE